MNQLKIYFDNVNFNSSSGPNSFGLKLARELHKTGYKIVSDNPDVQISFIHIQTKASKTLLRLDGIYFNSEQDWKQLNQPIKMSYDSVEGVVFQSEFNKVLAEKYFGKHKNASVIHNGTDIETIKLVPAFNHTLLKQFEKVWACASQWRPHKRLNDNIEYFLNFAGKQDCLLVAGDVGDNLDKKYLNNPRIIYVGMLDWFNLISIFKTADYFIHLAFLDHCPNVVVDARACGCHIVCASSGGTHEIAGSKSTVIKDLEWDYAPLKLYSPPKLDMNKIIATKTNSDINIKTVANKYILALKNL
jgi:glycosyltransferase involved in cell wall biosynthesis